MAEKKTTAKTAPAPAVETVENPVNKMIDGLVEKAQAALKEFLTLDQEQIDHIVHEMALAGLDKHQELARMAVEETGRGVYEDKVIKNMFATEYIWHDIKKEKEEKTSYDDFISAANGDLIVDENGVVVGK